MKAHATYPHRFVWPIVLVVFATVLIAPFQAHMTPAHALGGICSNSSTGRVPLTDGLGLYDTGNDMPASLANRAPAVAPINGVIGLVSLGMSNTSQEWEAFMTLVDSSTDVAADVRVADGAIAGKTMADWATDSGGVWGKAVTRIGARGLSADQVQVVWMKMGSKLGELAPTQDERIAQERAWLETVITRASDTFPNLKRIYISSRTYAGYAANGNHAEPETGWGNGLSVRTVAADSLAGKTAVWTAWGPYLWADGIAGRSDGLVWECSDFEDDGVHPSISGEAKVAGLLWDFFAGEPTACEWFLTDQSQCGTTGGGGGGTIPGHFDDVPADHTFYGDVEWLAGSGITLGCNPPEDTLFCPDDPVTRGQMAAFLDRALDLPDAPDAFADDAGSVFEGSINAIAGADITQGCNPPQNTRFCPNDLVTRGQMAAFLVRALGLPAGPDVFTDDDGSVFEADIQALARSGITHGCNPPINDRFCPGLAITRGQMAAFLHRAEPYLP